MGTGVTDHVRVITMREPVTLATAADLTGEPRSVIRELWRTRKIKAKACDVETHSLLFELWEVEAALASRAPYRRRVATTSGRRS